MRASVLAALSLVCAATTQSAPAIRTPRLEMVVALFRHGVRAPLKDLNAEDPRYTSNAWPSKEEWGLLVGTEWGDLTPHGFDAVRELGRAYAARYKELLPSGATAFLWADVDRRTRSTADALVEGLNKGGIPAATDHGTESVDPIFHAFRAGCAKPTENELRPIAQEISGKADGYIKNTYAASFRNLYDVLACKGSGCKPLDTVNDNSATYCVDAKTCCPGPAPIKWKGQFPVANTASETFLLEYENNMKYGWNDPKINVNDIASMLRLHEVYFGETQRKATLNAIDASNLLRQIAWRLNREKDGCRVLPDRALFTALVGHDTNIASLASLLGLHWSFRNAPYPTNLLPDNDPLPAGALVFELYRRFNGHRFVRIYYMAQGLDQVRNCRPGGPCPMFRVPLRQMELEEFTALAGRHANPPFVCCTGDDLCPKSAMIPAASSS